MSASEWNFNQSAHRVRTKVILPDPSKKWSGASIDTRTLKSGDVFFALQGKKQDGHEYLWEAFRRGASGAVITESFFKEAREKIFRERTLFHNLLAVPDPEKALAELAGAYRNECSAVGVGITGSVGKTSTKEFLRFLLGQKYPILATSGNLNNQLGLPLTLFQLKPEHQYCVAELGASRKGEIRELAALLKPRVGVITGVSAAHLEGFGSLAEIYPAKLELADALVKNKGVLVLPDRDPELIRQARKRKVSILFFGRKRSSDFRRTGLKVKDGWVEVEVNDRWSFRFPGHAPFQADNVLAAVAASFACGVLPSELPSVWKEIEFPKGRFEISSPIKGVTFVNDCYNANPYSFEKALEAFESLEAPPALRALSPEGRGRKILVFGDMLELGSEAQNYHRALGEWVQSKNFQALFTFGDWMRETALVCERGGNPPLVLHFEDKGMLTDFLSNFLKAGDQVLFKASRGMKLEEIIHALSHPLSSDSSVKPVH